MTIRCLWITRAHLSIVTCRANPDRGAAATGEGTRIQPRNELDKGGYKMQSTDGRLGLGLGLGLGLVRVRIRVTDPRQVTIDKCASVIHKQREVVITNCDNDNFKIMAVSGAK